MSAYVVNNETINTIVAYLGRNDNDDQMYMIRKYLANCGHLINDADPQDIHETKLEALGLAMFELNLTAVLQRYPDCSRTTCPGSIWFVNNYRGYEYSAELPPTIHQAYKYLRCWHYQCCEGEVPETSDLYKAFTEIGNDLAHHITSATSQYGAATWGADTRITQPQESEAQL